MEKKEILTVILLLLIAFFFRFFSLNSIPPGLYPDVAIYGNDAFFTLKEGKFLPFYPENNGREGMWMWILALSFSIFGTKIFTIKFISAFFGFLTVVLFYFLVRDFYSRSVALFSTFFLSISFWHTNFSRIGFRAILLPLFSLLFLYFFFHAIKSKKHYHYILSGFFFGLGFYTYTSFRLLLILLPILFIAFYNEFRTTNLLKRYFIFWLEFLTVSILVLLPLISYFVKHPDYLFARVGPISVFSGPNPAKEFLKSLVLHLGMFNIYGDPNWRHNISSAPVLFFPVGIFFILGFFYSIFTIKEKKYSLLLFWWFVMLLPGILTKEGIPHALRTIGAIPPTFIFAGIGANLVFQRIRNESLLIIFLLFVFSFIFFEYHRYFVYWANLPQVSDAFSKDFVEMGNFLTSLGENVEKYVVVNVPGVPVGWANQIPMPAQTIIFLEFSKYQEMKIHYILPNDVERIKIEKGGIIAPMAYDKNLFSQLQKIFPHGAIKRINNFYFYEVRR